MLLTVVQHALRGLERQHEDMPEGDTVWRTAQRLHNALAGETLTRSDFRVPAFATSDLSGRKVLEVVPRGKHLLARIEGDLTLHTHLRMEGAWRVYSRPSRWRGGPSWQIRLILSTDTIDAVGYRLPVVELLPTAREADVVGHIGPDLLDPAFDKETALQRLRERPDQQIGPALLDQRNLAGIGNLYKAETLFVCRVSPWSRVGDVADLGRIVEEGRRLLMSNRERPEQSTTGDLRRGFRHFVFERERLPCRRCGSPVMSRRQGQPPRDRITYWCATCQPSDNS
ncbi:MAG: DNA-formamidopyrimidine glycosylase family protein [Candidatus Nanopelagicales bacterium]